MQSVLEKQTELLEEVVHPIHEAIDSLHIWMLAIGVFFWSGWKLYWVGSLMAILWFCLMLANSGARGVGFHGCFSPRASATITTPIMIMSVLMELFGGVPMHQGSDARLA
jgi:hypothetical protein